MLQVVINPPGRIGNKNILDTRPRNVPFKMKKLLLQSKVVEVKKKKKKKKKWSSGAKNECQ